MTKKKFLENFFFIFAYHRWLEFVNRRADVKCLFQLSNEKSGKTQQHHRQQKRIKEGNSTKSTCILS